MRGKYDRSSGEYSGNRWAVVIARAYRVGDLRDRGVRIEKCGGRKMINSKGEIIYTNAEVAYELGISPATVNAIGKRLFGSGRIAYWTLNDVKLIVQYAKSISVEEDAKRLARLHDVVAEIMGESLFEDESLKKQIAKDLYKVG